MSGRSEALRQKFPVEFPCVVPVKVRREVHVTGDANGVVTDNVKVHASVTASKCVLCHGSESKEHKRKNPLLSGEKTTGVREHNPVVFVSFVYDVVRVIVMEHVG